MKKTTGHNQKGGYSIIAAVLMIGFLLVLTTSTLNLVLQEMQDGKGRQDYMKAYAGAEGALELALLKIKQKGYGYDGLIENSEILGTGNKIPKLSYDFESKVSSYTGNIAAYDTDIIPLFWLDDSGSGSVSNINFDGDGLIWNIITKTGGVSGIGDFHPTTPVGEKTYDENTQELKYSTTETVSSILSGEDYLILYNPSSGGRDYELSGGSFTLPRARISSSARVGKYSQNLETIVDNTAFLGILKYSIYSGE